LLEAAFAGDRDANRDQRDMERERCRTSFRYFLRHWCFRNRETGQVQSFAELWPGQEELATLIEAEPWLFALKAGKLGFTELECAYDGWALLFCQRNARVHIFSREAQAAQELLGYVRFGLTHLPEWLGLPVLADTGGDTSRSLKLDAGPDDIRTVVSYSANPRAAIDQTATHVHVDELAHVTAPAQLWSAIQSSVAPDGSCHVITRGTDDAFLYELWQSAVGGESKLHAFFAPWTARPDRTDGWRAEQAASMPPAELLYFAPETPEDAFAAGEVLTYIEEAVWDLCTDETLPPMLPGDQTQLVLGVDAGYSHDCMAIVVASRHPTRPSTAAIREVKVWDPRAMGRPVDFDEVERWLRYYCQGGCLNGHPRSMPSARCGYCLAGAFTVLPHRVMQIAFDPSMILPMIQRLQRDRVAWCVQIQQGGPRETADTYLAGLAVQRRITHNGDLTLRQHVLNSAAKVYPDDRSTLRIVKRTPSRPVDAAVAMSMAVYQAMTLNLVPLPARNAR